MLLWYNYIIEIGHPQGGERTHGEDSFELLYEGRWRGENFPARFAYTVQLSPS